MSTLNLSRLDLKHIPRVTMFKFKLPPKVKMVTHHQIMSQAAIALALSALSLLLLVLVLLSVPGPIKGLYWFSVPADVSGMGKLTTGVSGWCGACPRNCSHHMA